MKKEDRFKFLIENSMILSALSTIWQVKPDEKKIIAKKMLNDFSDLDWLLFAYIDFKSTVGGNISIIQQQNNNKALLISIGIFQIELWIDSKIKKSDKNIVVIEYSGFNKFAFLKGTNMPVLKAVTLPYKHNPIKLMLALSHIRYNFDSILYLPKEMRNHRLDIMENEYKLPVENLLSFDKQLREIPDNLNL